MDSDVLIAVPDDLGDSAMRHAYDVHKVWEMPRAQLINLGDLDEIDLSNKALIFFNDTHGSGKQFIREIWTKYDIPNRGSRFNMVVAANIASTALELFERTGGLIVWPESAAPSIQDNQNFTAREVARLRELGEKVYPAHPLGFGETGLLVAYSFQCPNNTLPLIWADGKNNGLRGELGYPWSPLFPYRPKITPKVTPAPEGGSRQTTTVSAKGISTSADAANSGNSVLIRRYLEGFIKQLNAKIAQTMLLPLQETPSALEQLDFFTNVIASPVQPNLGAFGEEDREATRHQSFGEAFKKLDERVLLLGVPGAGKTTTLFQFTRDACRERLADSTKPVPYFTSIQNWDHKTPLKEWVRGQIPNLSRLLPDNEPLLYIFDGLDELGGERPVDPSKPDGEKYDPRARFLEAVATQLPDGKVVISCREQDYIQLGIKASLNGAVKLLPLEAVDIQRVLLAKGQEKLWQALDEDSALLELARTPLLLTLLSSAVGEDKGPIDIHQGNVTAKTIFDYYIVQRYVHEAVKGELEFDLNTTRLFLENLAAYRWLSGIGETESMTLFHPEIENIIGEKWEQFLKLAFELNFLRPVSPYAVQFIHLKFRDHCALPTILVALDDRDSRNRSRAIWALEEIKDPSTIPNLLTAALTDEVSDVRSSAAEALGHIKDPSTIPNLLTALLTDENDYVRSCAAKALGQIKDSSAIPVLLSSLEDENSYVRSKAVIALGQINDPSTIPNLLGSLESDDKYVRWHIVDVLGLFKDPSTIPPLLTVLKNRDEDYDVRWNVIKVLGQIGHPTCLPDLTNTLKDENEDTFMRSWAATALGQIGNPSAVPDLLHTLKYEHRFERASAAIALGRIKDPSTIPDLLLALRENNSDVRSSAAISLGQFNDPCTIPDLLVSLKDINRDVRSNAAIALGDIRNISALPALLEALAYEETFVRASIAIALRDIKDSTAVPALLIALKEDDSFLRSCVIEALGEIRDSIAIPALLAALNDDSLEVRSSAVAALQAMQSEIDWQPETIE